MTFNDWVNIDDALRTLPRGSAAWEILYDCSRSGDTPETLRQEIQELSAELEETEFALLAEKRAA